MGALGVGLATDNEEPVVGAEPWVLFVCVEHVFLKSTVFMGELAVDGEGSSSDLS